MPLWYNETIEEYLTFAEKHLTYDKARAILRTARTGNEALVTQANTYVAQMDQYRFESTGYKWMPTPEGCYPSIPDVIQGSPTPMRSRRKTIRDTGPIRVFVGASLNSGCSTENYLRRGMVIMALVMFLQRMRPVSLYLWEDSRGYRDGTITSRPTANDGAFITVINIGTQPMCLAQVAYVMSTVDFSRDIIYELVSKKNYACDGLRYPSHYMNAFMNYDPRTALANDAGYIGWLRGYLDAGEHDVFIPSAHTSQMLDNPVDWLDRMLKKIVPEWQENA